MEIREYREGDEADVVALWERCGLTRVWNDPRKDIARKLRVQRELFLVGVVEGEVVGTVMGGYEGHRGWLNYLAVDPDRRRQGIGRALVLEIERRLGALGCPKINLQIRRSNGEASSFYAAIGYGEDDVISFGKRLEQDRPLT
jgi:ribosomal protein S18 acetylase RimI-like enzyme